MGGPPRPHTHAGVLQAALASAGRQMHGGHPQRCGRCQLWIIPSTHRGRLQQSATHTLSDSTSHREGGWLLHRLSLQTTAYRLRHPETGNFIQFLVSNTAKSEVCSATGCGEPSVLSLCLKAQVKVLPRYCLIVLLNSFTSFVLPPVTGNRRKHGCSARRALGDTGTIVSPCTSFNKIQATVLNYLLITL